MERLTVGDLAVQCAVGCGVRGVQWGAVCSGVQCAVGCAVRGVQWVRWGAVCGGVYALQDSVNCVLGTQNSSPVKF